MIGYEFVESEPDIKKIIPLNDRWWIMFAGNDISPVFPIADSARKKIISQMDVDDIIGSVFDAYKTERDSRAANLFISPYGLTESNYYQNGLKILGGSLFREIAYKRADYKLNLQLIVAGFDGAMNGRIAYIDDSGPIRLDIPGFSTIGSGYTGAQFMMSYRRFSPSMALREAVYYTVEAKYFGEQATGVGAVTDLQIHRAGKPIVTLGDDEIDKQIINKICARLEPRPLETAANAVLLNAIDLGADCPRLKLDKKTKKLITE